MWCPSLPNSKPFSKSLPSILTWKRKTYAKRCFLPPKRCESARYLWSPVNEAAERSSSELVGKLLRPSEDRRDLDGLGAKPVYNSKPADDNLSNVVLIALGDHSSRFWKVLEAFNGCDDSTDREVGVTRRVFCDVCANCLDVPQRLGGPDDAGHRPRRRLASSWGMPLPASSSLRPASILARNTRRSIASSTVASGGISRSASMIRSRVSGSDMIGFYAMPPTSAARHDASPPDWAQNWAHDFSNAANHSEISAFQARPSLPWRRGRWFEYGDSGAREWYGRYSTGAERRLAHDVLVAAPLASRCDDGVREGRL
jgi:hypothetical protein